MSSMPPYNSDELKSKPNKCAFLRRVPDLGPRIYVVFYEELKAKLTTASYPWLFRLQQTIHFRIQMLVISVVSQDEG